MFVFDLYADATGGPRGTVISSGISTAPLSDIAISTLNPILYMRGQFTASSDCNFSLMWGSDPGGKLKAGSFLKIDPINYSG
jgi:hypothetical protein